MRGNHPTFPTYLYRLRGRIGSGIRSLLLSAGQNRIGRSEANDLVIALPGVSREHAVVRQAPESLEVEDLGSRNGTFVNGLPVGRSVIRPGDTLRLGPVELVLEEIDAGDAALGVVVAEARPAEPPSPDHSTPYLRTKPARAAPPSVDLVFPQGCVPGRSPAITRLYESMAPLLTADLPVLIEGETGTGKELVARTLHLSSRRKDGPFVAVNCAAIPSELLEAEMFGIGQGVATGVRQREGKFRSAQGGTLFLDEIGEMPPELQAKLLRALQEKEIQPVGGPPVPVDVWVVAATNVDLLKRIEEERFRRDLYYRVAGFVLAVPPLRERRKDVPLLIEHFLRRFAAENGKTIRGMTVNAVKTMVHHPWPGNVRELEHEVRRLANLCADGEAIESTMLAERLQTPPPPPREQEARPSPDPVTRSQPIPKPEAPEPESPTPSLRLADHVRRAERQAILQALEHAAGSQRQAARLLGISRNTLARKIQQLGIPT